jgi:hypothetical protein
MNQPTANLLMVVLLPTKENKKLSAATNSKLANERLPIIDGLMGRLPFADAKIGNSITSNALINVHPEY